jgi:hypothetical protein
MKKLIFSLLAGALALAGLALTPAAAPAMDHGHWEYLGGRYVWVPPQRPGWHHGHHYFHNGRGLEWEQGWGGLGRYSQPNGSFFYPYPVYNYSYPRYVYPNSFVPNPYPQ